jgi:hypothetical protein
MYQTYQELHLDDEGTTQDKSFYVVPSSESYLTKDNLIKRDWIGNESHCFCDNKKSIEYLFFECPFAKVIWHIIYMTFGLAPPKNVTNLFGNWFKGIPKKDLVQIGDRCMRGYLDLMEH